MTLPRATRFSGPPVAAHEGVVEALISFVLAVLFVFVFAMPAWLAKLVPVGGVTCVLWVFILAIEWVVGWARRPRVP